MLSQKSVAVRNELAALSRRVELVKNLSFAKDVLPDEEYREAIRCTAFALVQTKPIVIVCNGH